MLHESYGTTYDGEYHSFQELVKLLVIGAEKAIFGILITCKTKEWAGTIINGPWNEYVALLLKQCFNMHVFTEHYNWEILRELKMQIDTVYLRQNAIAS